MRRRYPEYEIITDIGSGINFRRKNFTALLESICRGDVQEIVVAHRDRLARFKFELVSWLVTHHGGRLVVLDETHLSPTEELTRDLLSIIHIFSCRMHGLRKYRAEIKKDKDATRLHQLKCRDEAMRLFSNRTFLKPYGYKTVSYYFFEL